MGLYQKIVWDQLKEGIIEAAPKMPTGDCTLYIPHKLVLREEAATMKVTMVFDASVKPHLLANSANDCMHTGPSLQPLLWDILIRAHMSTHLLLADIQKASLQTGMYFASFST